jgi:uncharacterized protein (DUF1778 family)
MKGNTMVKTKDDHLTIRIASEDKEKIKEAAKRGRLTLSAFVEKTLLDKAAKVNKGKK